MADTITTIEIPITAEGVMGLKQACETIKNTYQKYSLSQVASDENAIYPSLLPMISGMKIDAGAGVGAFEAYDKTSLDDIQRPEQPAGTLNSYKDLENVTGNYPISQQTYDEAKTEADKILNGMKSDETPVDNEELGGSFNQGSRIDIREQQSVRAQTQIPGRKILSETVNQDTGETQRPNLRTDTTEEISASITSGLLTLPTKSSI